MSSEIWLRPETENRRFAAAFGIGLLLELAALFMLVPYIAHRQPPPADQQAPVKLTIMAPAPPAPPPPVPVPPKPVPPPPVPVPPPPVPVPVMAPLPLPLPPPPPLPAPARMVARRPPRHVVAAPVAQPPVTPTPTPPPPTPTPTPTPPAAAPAAPSGGELAMFEAELHRAVQTALIFPDAAQMARESGVVQLRFTYFNGVVSNITVTRSCGFPILDAAAVETARSAHYPLPPPDFSGRVETVDVDVVFPLAAPSVDSD